ncbi:VapA/VapB family virulence-associated protein [Xenorhabdus stockiae]|uniref:VapA/VapB family virulence-associated protein n=1 Tax=Xenorhabdus stockiae TaxID=351614 RepID=UPI004062F99E
MNKILINEQRLKTADYLSEKLTGKLEQQKIDKIRETILSDKSNGYSATLKMGSFLFYQTCSLELTDGKNFYGDGGGLMSLGAGRYEGTLYTDDIDFLYKNGTAYTSAVTFFVGSMQFWNGFNVIGHFEGFGKGTTDGESAGKGYWE